MHKFKFILLFLGIGLLAFILLNINLQETVQYLYRVGFGFLLILFLYFLAFLFDTFTWQLTLENIPLTGRWIYRCFKIRLVGEAFNNLTPFAGMGGEPLKAILLKQSYGYGYSDGIASLILTKTINVIALILFLAAGLLFILESAKLAVQIKIVASMGLVSLTFCIFLFFLAQRFKITSTAGILLSKYKPLAWLLQKLLHVEAIEDRLVKFYTEKRAKFSSALILAFSNWLLGVLEIYYTMQFLNFPVSLVDAWIIESVAQLIRAGVFFIPASIGVQEGVFIIIGSSITGSPTAGFAVAIVRRVREITWMAWGVIIFYFAKTKIDMNAIQDAEIKKVS